MHNPTYAAATPSIYSSVGPRNTPTGHAPPQRKEERVYHELEQPEGEEEGGEERIYHMLEEAGDEGEDQDTEQEEEEVVYHELGEVVEGQEGGAMPYQVPIETQSKSKEMDGTERKAAAYSTLQHK